MQLTGMQLCGTFLKLDLELIVFLFFFILGGPVPRGTRRPPQNEKKQKKQKRKNKTKKQKQKQKIIKNFLI